MTLRSRMKDVVRRALGRPGELRTYTVVGLVDLDAHGGRSPRLEIAGIVPGTVVEIVEELSGDGRGRRFCHQVRARSAEAAEVEARAYVSYVHSLTVDR